MTSWTREGPGTEESVSSGHFEGPLPASSCSCHCTAAVLSSPCGPSSLTPRGPVWKPSSGIQDL